MNYSEPGEVQIMSLEAKIFERFSREQEKKDQRDYAQNCFGCTSDRDNVVFLVQKNWVWILSLEWMGAY